MNLNYCTQKIILKEVIAMVYVLLILGFIRKRLAKRIELADSGKKVEVMHYVRNTYDFLDFVYIMRSSGSNSYYLLGSM